MKKILTAGLVGITMTTGAIARTPITDGSRPRCKYPCYVVKNTVVHHHDHDDRTAEFLIAGAVVGVIVGVILFNRPVDVTHASVRF